MRTQLAAHANLLSTEQPNLTLGGYGKTVLYVMGREIVFDARLSTADEFVTMARAQVKKDEGIHRIDVSLGEHSLLAKVHDQEGHLVDDWQTMLSLAVIMKFARAKF